jgi:hypothetical protein
MDRKSALLGLVVVVSMCHTAHAGNRGSLLLDERYSRPILSPALTISDTLSGGSAASGEAVIGESGKSPKKAFLFSALVPGTGELYAGSRRGYFFLGFEIACWVTWVLLDQKGDALRDDFEGFADEHWIKERYVHWEGTYLDTTDFKKTHTLPAERDQQYYEMIGKYDQFVLGWDDTDEYDPSLFATIQDLAEVYSDNRLIYRDMRAESNDYLKPAGYVLGAILFNHVLSAIHAPRCARAQNASLSEQSVRFQVAIKSDGLRPIPMLVASRRF